MSRSTAGAVFVLSLVAALTGAYRPFGDYVFRAVSGQRRSRVERGGERGAGRTSSADPSVSIALPASNKRHLSRPRARL